MGGIMFRKIMLCVTGLVWFASAVPSFADEVPKSKYRTITGCLSKPEGGDEYFLVGKNGSTWEIHSRSSSVALHKHVGQTVKVRGIVEHSKMHNMKEDAKEDTGIKRHENEHGHLKVTSIHEVGLSCRD
jgi:hypothetical protein